MKRELKEKISPATHHGITGAAAQIPMKRELKDGHDYLLRSRLISAAAQIPMKRELKGLIFSFVSFVSII